MEIPTLILQGSPPRDVRKSLTSPGNTHAENPRVRIKGPSLHRKKEKKVRFTEKQITPKDRYVSFAARLLYFRFLEAHTKWRPMRENQAKRIMTSNGIHFRTKGK